MSGTGKPVGRPPKGQERITEGNYPDIYRRWLRGTSVHTLAREYSVDWNTMQHHLQKCRTMLKSVMLRDRNEVLDELSAVREAAWECFQKSKRPLTHDEVQKEVDKAVAEGKISEAVASRIIKQTTKITTRDGEANWLSVVLASIDTEAKLMGHYEAGKREGSSQAVKGKFRAAGRSPSDTHEAMAARLVDLLQSRREALTTGNN